MGRIHITMWILTNIISMITSHVHGGLSRTECLIELVLPNYPSFEHWLSLMTTINEKWVTHVDDMAWMSQMTHSMVICGFYSYWWLDGDLQPLEMVLVHEKFWHSHTLWYDGTWTHLIAWCWSMLPFDDGLKFHGENLD